jgi:aspartyl-tRNA synthetase
LVKLKLKDRLEFCWVTEFPLFEKDDIGKLKSCHHPFTAPLPEHIPLIETDPLHVKSQSYDLVLNGQEVGGGSIRIHNADFQRYILTDVMKLTQQQVQSLEHLMTAFKYGAPPHGGIAFGLDRLLAVMCNCDNIKDVIAFPKTKSGRDLVISSPSRVNAAELKEYGLVLEGRGDPYELDKGLLN